MATPTSAIGRIAVSEVPLARRCDIRDHITWSGTNRNPPPTPRRPLVKPAMPPMAAETILAGPGCLRGKLPSADLDHGQAPEGANANLRGKLSGELPERVLLRAARDRRGWPAGVRPFANLVVERQRAEERNPELGALVL